MEETEYVHDEEEEEKQEDVSEGEAFEGEVHDPSLKVNDKVTLHQPELCLIYTALYWACRSDGLSRNDVEIKQIVGHAVLKLDEDKYPSLGLTQVIKLLHKDEDQYTRDVKLFVSWCQQQHENYLDMYRKDEKFAKQRDCEGFLQKEALQASTRTRPGKRRRLEEPGLDESTATVSPSLYGGSQGGQQVGDTILFRWSTLQSLPCWQGHLTGVKIARVEARVCRTWNRGTENGEIGMAITHRLLDEIDMIWNE